MAEQYDNEIAAENEARESRNSFLAWPVLLALGWVLYEITAQPNVAIICICLKFGWDDFRTGFWLRRTDPVRSRAWACFWLSIGSGFWRAAITATIAIIASLWFFEPRQAPQGAARPAAGNWVPWGQGALLTAGVGFGLSALATYLALWLGLRNRIKFWLGSGVHRARRRNHWPPYEANSGLNEQNKGSGVIFTALILLDLLILLTVGILCAVVARPLPDIALIVIVVLAGAGIPSLGALSILFQRDYIKRRLLASAPWQCWEASEPMKEAAQSLIDGTQISSAADHNGLRSSNGWRTVDLPKKL